MSNINWSQLFKHRKVVNSRFKSIWSLPIAPRYSDILFGTKIKPSALLEVGAGERGLKKKVNKRWPSCHYASFDVDRNSNHDFFTLEEITGKYDLVCMFEIIEHVRPEVALEILNKCYEVLNPGGLIMVTTPNTYYPPAYLRDATHITPWCYDELGAISQLAGFKVSQLYRLYKESLFKKIIRRYLGYPIFRLVRIDFAKQIMLVGEKPNI